MDRRLRILALPLAALALLVLPACGDSGGGGGPTGPNPNPPAFDVTGTWSITESVDPTACGDPKYTETYTLTVTQSGSSLTVITPDGKFSGTINGDKISWTGSYPDAGGTTTVTSLNLTVASGGTSLSGSSTWTWTDGSFTCSGTTQVSGTKM